MQITIDTSVELTTTEQSMLKDLLQSLLGEDTKTTVTEPAQKPAPAKRPASKPVVTEPEPEPEEDEDDDLVGTVEPVTQEQVVAKVTDMVGGGEKPKVIAALKAVGAKKVTEIPEAKLQAFWDQLQG